MFRWKFDSKNPTAHAAWLAFHDHRETTARNTGVWPYDVLEGKEQTEIKLIQI